LKPGNGDGAAVGWGGEIRSTKSEIRNKFQARSSNVQNRALEVFVDITPYRSRRRSEVSIIRILNFGFVSDFVLRISDFRLSRFVPVIF
jgi:hypothetical protein